MWHLFVISCQVVLYNIISLFGDSGCSVVTQPAQAQPKSSITIYIEECELAFFVYLCSGSFHWALSVFI